MGSLHTITLKESPDQEDHTDIYIESVYLSYTLIKTVRTRRLIQDFEEDYQNILYHDDPDTDHSCSLCGRTDSKKEIIADIMNGGHEELYSKKLHLCNYCSKVIQHKLTSELKNYRPEDLLLNNI